MHSKLVHNKLEFDLLNKWSFWWKAIDYLLLLCSQHGQEDPVVSSLLDSVLSQFS